MSTSPQNPERLLRRLDWTVIRRLDGLLQGDYRTLLRGSGMDLADVREYQLHDDARHIDWNVTARMQVPHVREHNEDREITAWFLLDMSASMDFGSTDVSKRDVLTEFTAVMARVLTRRGNRVGVLVYGGEMDMVIPPRSGRGHVLHILDTLMKRPPAKADAKATDLSAFLRAAFNVIRRRSLLFVVSDFVSTPGWDEPLAMLGRRHELLAVRVVDPLERELPDLGMLMVQDCETGERLFVDTHDRGFRKRFEREAEQREGALMDALGRAGVDALELNTIEDIIDPLVRFSQLRRWRGRGSPARHHGSPSASLGATA